MAETSNKLIQDWLGNLDPVLGVPVVMDVVHHEIHEGEMFSADHSVASLANGGTVELMFTTTTKTAHMSMNLVAGGQATVYFYENMAGSAGTAVTPYNMNRTSANATTVALVHTPSVTNLGGTVALINGRVIPGGASPTTRAGGAAREGTEWILGSATKHLLRIVNTSGGAIAACATINWYEE